MKKLVLIMLLALSVTLLSSHGVKKVADTRIITRCGFATEMQAIRYMAYNILINEDEEVTQVHTDGQTGNWCITLTITCID